MFEKTSTIIEGEPITIKIPSVKEWTMTNLKNCCKKNKVKGYTRMNRNQLIAEVKKIIKNFKS